MLCVMLSPSPAVCPCAPLLSNGFISLSGFHDMPPLDAAVVIPDVVLARTPPFGIDFTAHTAAASSVFGAEPAGGKLVPI